MNVFNLLKNPSAYIKKAKYSVVGWYSDTFNKYLVIDDMKFTLPDYGNDRAGRGLMFLNQYEEPERILLKKCISPQANVIELGACIGVVSCTTNKILKNPKNHVVVEANPLLIETLAHNKKINNCSFTIVNAMVSDNQDNDFYVGDSMVASSAVAQSNRKISVKGTSFKQIEIDHNIKFDTLVMDIEGGEHYIILNNIDFIKTIKVICLENHPSILSADKIVEYENVLLSNGFVKTKELSPITVWEQLALV